MTMLCYPAALLLLMLFLLEVSQRHWRCSKYNPVIVAVSIHGSLYFYNPLVIV